MKTCEKCSERMNKKLHEDSFACLSTQMNVLHSKLQDKLDESQNEIEKLKLSVEAWRTAWYDLRDIIGKLWWHHPAIKSDETREYYKKMTDDIG